MDEPAGHTRDDRRHEQEVWVIVWWLSICHCISAYCTCRVILFINYRRSFITRVHFRAHVYFILEMGIVI